MSKTGRNDPCPCGSGKKYKKCCLDKDIDNTIKNERENAAIYTESIAEKAAKYSNNFLDYSDVDKLTTAEIFSKLHELGMPVTEEEFISDTEKYYSAENLSEDWFKIYQADINDKYEDFPWLAAWVLWERLAVQKNLSLEQMEDLLCAGYDCLDENNPCGACDAWLELWEGIKYKNNPEYKNMDFLEDIYRGAFYVKNVCQDLEYTLVSAGHEDLEYFKRRISYCTEFLELFPEEDDQIIHNMRRAIPESYSMTGEYEKAEKEFEKLVRDYPDNCWSYISWADMYDFNMKEKLEKAKELYQKALEIAKDPDDIEVIKERLEDIRIQKTDIR